MTNNSAAVIFDLDGVVIDTEPLYTKAEIKLFEEYGIHIPEKDCALFRGCSEQTFFDLSMKRYGITEDKDVFIAKSREYVRNEFSDNLTFMPGFKNLHWRINKHYKTGLVTATSRSTLNWIINQIELDNFFKHILSGDETKRNKPYPDPYMMMMKFLSVQPENTVIVEDSLHGLQSGLSAGGNVIAITGSVSANDLSSAHRIVQHLNEITIEMIKELLPDT